MIKKYLRIACSPLLVPCRAFGGKFSWKAAATARTGVTPAWQGVLGWALLSAEGSVLGRSNVSLQRENQTKKGCSLLVTSPSRHRNPQGLFSPGSHHQETFTLGVALINLGTFSFS